MAAINQYLGLKRGADNNPDNTVAGTSSNGTGSDVEVRIQIDNGSTATNITRGEVVILLKVIEEFILGGGIAGAGANLPAL